MVYHHSNTISKIDFRINQINDLIINSSDASLKLLSDEKTILRIGGHIIPI